MPRRREVWWDVVTLRDMHMWTERERVQWRFQADISDKQEQANSSRDRSNRSN